jgi:DNA-binding MarR family transcriptional regulator
MTHLFTDPDALRFLKYLNLINATKGKSYAANLNDAEIRVLNTLALGWHVGEPITVTDAILVNTQCCSSSTHRILKKLRQKEYVELLVSEIDNRVKYLLPTAATVAYFALMGRCLMES